MDGRLELVHLLDVGPDAASLLLGLFVGLLEDLGLGASGGGGASAFSMAAVLPF